MSARQALLEGDYEAVVKTAVMFGDDTDTTACVVGGIAGLQYGIAGVPSRWVESLRGQSLVEPLVEGLIASRLH